MTVLLPEPETATPAARAGGGRSGRRRARRVRRPRLMPYALLVPAVAAIGVGLGYPLYRLAVMSTQEFGLRQQFGTAPPESVGLANYRDIFGDSYFWEVLRRSVVFCLVNVTLTIVLGTLVAVLLTRLGKRMRVAVSSALLLAWATPALTATVVWQWIFDPRYGVVNWLLTRLGGDFEGHSWLSEPLSFYFVATLIVVWMGIPFVALTVYAGMTQIPGEVMEAASIDGAGPWARFRDVTWPSLRPLFVVLIALSTLWDLRVFTQIYVLQQAGSITRETNLLGTWAYRVSVGGNDFDVGATVAIIMVGLTLLLTLVYLRSMFRQEDLA
ncbi:MAG TPA: sugar ABC transporter permease [Acidimicrobiales bacterium]|jgi:N,N'-diacetylchitobiose transport system permease protein|nr:sugar ABC transporter permease [Acidimicrobiales bacterium]